MCGRAAQTHETVVMAARSLGVPEASIPKEPSSPPPPAAAAATGAATMTTSSVGGSTEPTAATLTTAMMEEAAAADSSAPSTPQKQQMQQHSQHEWHDNYNMSPGMDAFVVYRDDDNPTHQQLRCDLMRWGLITRGGTSQAPLDTSSMAQHFALRMFNARTDTLMEKPSFSRLVKQGRTCIVALTGFYEWKETPASKKKQPYFVFGKNDQVLSYLLLAGLWTRVPTGCTSDHNNGEPEHLDTFTILTTDVSPTLKWLHTRMPVVLDEASAQLWLNEPSKKQLWTHPRQTQLLHQIEAVAHALPVNWHPVTPNMSSLKFRSAESIKPIKEPKSIASFFAATGSTKAVAGKSPASTLKLTSRAVASGSLSSTLPGAATIGGDVPHDIVKKRKRDGDDNEHADEKGSRSAVTRARNESTKPTRGAGAPTSSSSTSTPFTKRPSTAKPSSASPTTRKTLHSFFSPKKAASSSSTGGGGSNTTRE